MTTLTGSGLHLLFALRDPKTCVVLERPEPVEPAILSYYLAHIGIGPGGRLEQTYGTVEGPADDGAARFTVQAQINSDRAVQVLSAHERDADGYRFPAPAAAVDDLYRHGARAAAALAVEGAVGRVEIDFAFADDYLFTVGVRDHEGPAAAAHATVLALRANAFRASGTLRVPSRPAWREALATLRAAGVLWNPTARAGVVVYGLESVEETGELSLVALGSSLFEADERFYTAVTALGAVQAPTTVGAAR